jgi:hypothetical protein
MESGFNRLKKKPTGELAHQNDEPQDSITPQNYMITVTTRRKTLSNGVTIKSYTTEQNHT